MRFTPLSLALLALIGCAGSDGKRKPGETAGANSENPVGPNDATTDATFRGKYEVTSLEVDPELDTDGDGEIDNKLADALFVMDSLMDQDFSVPGFNALLDEALTINLMLFDAIERDGVLSISILYGAREGDGTITVDPGSYVDGAPANVLEGAFTTGEGFVAGPSTLDLSVTFDPEVGPAQVHVVDVELLGTMGSAAVAGDLVGVIPVRAIIDDVIDGLIPSEGADMNGNGEIDDGESKEEIMELVELVAPTLADVTLEDGGQGVSSVFHFTAAAATF